MDIHSRFEFVFDFEVEWIEGVPAIVLKVEAEVEGIAERGPACGGRARALIGLIVNHNAPALTPRSKKP